MDTTRIDKWVVEAMTDGINVPSRELVADIPWLVWNAQNAFVFQGRKPIPESIVDDALAMNRGFVIRSPA